MAWLPRQSGASLTPRDIRFDVHNHLLPGVDDGVADLDEAVEAVDVLQTLGYEGAVLTPHIHHDSFANDEASLKDQFDRFRDELRRHHPDFILRLAAEYYLDEHFMGKLYDAPRTLLRFGSDLSQVLVEFPFSIAPAFVGEFLDECRRHGLTPVIAHVERYRYVIEDRADRYVRPWKEGGALIQVNLCSLVGAYGSDEERAARRLLREGSIDLLGTDTHRVPSTRLHVKAWRRIPRARFNPAHHLRVMAPANGDLTAESA